MAADPITCYTLGNVCPDEAKYRGAPVPVRYCLGCKCKLSRYTVGEHCHPCVERVTYRGLK